MSERIERWVNVYPSGVGLECNTREEADREQDPGRIRCARLVELRDGESISVDPATVSMVPIAMYNAAIERAEKAEKAWRYLVKTIDDANTDERARFERETAARLLAGFVTRDPMPKDAFERAASGAAIAADHYFGAKEAKG